jgi:hypothetical protein
MSNQCEKESQRNCRSRIYLGSCTSCANEFRWFQESHLQEEDSQCASAVNSVKHGRQPLIGVRNCHLLPISKQARSKVLFVSRFSPEVSADDIEKSLKGQLSEISWSEPD